VKYSKTALALACLFTHSILHAQADGELSQGNEYYRQSQFDLAEKQYRLALQKDSLNTAAKHNLANALYRQRKFAEATTVLQRLRGGLKNGEPKGGAYYNEGVIYSKQKDLQKSIDAYKDALRNNPSDKEARENLQKALLELKKQQRDQQNQQKEKRPSKMNSREAERQLEKLQKKEEKLQERLQKKGQGSSMQKDW